MACLLRLHVVKDARLNGTLARRRSLGEQLLCREERPRGYRPRIGVDGAQGLVVAAEMLRRCSLRRQLGAAP